MFKRESYLLPGRGLIVNMSTFNRAASYV